MFSTTCTFLENVGCIRKLYLNQGLNFIHLITTDAPKSNPFNVDIGFVVDGTASMGRYILDVKNHVSEIVHKTIEKYPNSTVRVGFVAYRDYTEKKMNIEALDMTDNITKFVEFVGKLKAYAGGDVPENVLGGLGRALQLDWKSPNRILFHIGISQLLIYGPSILLLIRQLVIFDNDQIFQNILRGCSTSWRRILYA